MRIIKYNCPNYDAGDRMSVNAFAEDERLVKQAGITEIKIPLLSSYLKRKMAVLFYNCVSC